MDKKIVVLLIGSLCIFYLLPTKNVNLEKNVKCENRKFITTWDDGRLGNMMCAYATLFAYAKKFNLKPVITERLSKGLSMFPNLSYKDFHNKCEFQWTLFTTEEMKKVSNDEIEKIKNVKISTFACEIEEFHQYRKDIFAEFQFDKKIEKKAENYLKEIQSENYVGIHVRRTDYISFFKNKYNKSIPNLSYYKRAMQYFKQKYHNVTFVLISDDKKWCKKFIANNSRNVIVTPKDNSPELDLCIIKKCNDTIISVGTFGFWSAYLNEKAEVVRSSNFPSQKWAKTNLPTWKYYV